MSETHTSAGKRSRRRHRRERGQSLVEFTLAAPVLIIALLGLAELGNALNSYLTIVNTARDAARLYSQGGATDSALQAMIDRETGRLAADIPTNSLNACGDKQLGVCKQVLGPAPPSADARVSIRVCYDHPVIIGIPVILPGPIRMCSTTIMRVAL